MSPARTKRTLSAVLRAAQARERAREHFRAAIVEARRDGHTLQAIADAAGVTRQAISEQLPREDAS